MSADLFMQQIRFHAHYQGTEFSAFAEHIEWEQGPFRYAAPFVREASEECSSTTNDGCDHTSLVPYSCVAALVQSNKQNDQTDRIEEEACFIIITAAQRKLCAKDTNRCNQALVEAGP